jgi:hypothetical protein
VNPIEGYRPNPLLTVHDRGEFGSYVAAERCQSTIFPIAINQRSAQLLFEPLYRAGERGLGHSAPHRCFGEVQGVRQVQEISDLVEFHFSSLTTSSFAAFNRQALSSAAIAAPHGNYTCRLLENFASPCDN